MKFFLRKRRWWQILFLLASIGMILLLAVNKREETIYSTLPVKRQVIEATITAVGTLQPRRYVDVGAQVSGQVNRLYVEPGDEVERGQLLVEIDPSVQQSTVDASRAQLAGLYAQLADQQAQHGLAKQQLDRQKALTLVDATRVMDLQIAEADLASAVARIAFLEAQITQTQASLQADETRLGYTRIYAPISGTVIAVEAREGQTLNATYQTPRILRIADLSGMTVWTDVSEADISRIKQGQQVIFTTLGEIGLQTPRQWESRVRQILPAPPASDAVNESSVSTSRAVMYRVLFDVDNPEGHLMPQMTAQVSFVTARADNVLAIPLTALQSASANTDTYLARVLNGKGQAELRPVQVGVRNRHLVEITTGLQEGDLVVIGEQQPKRGLTWLTW